MVSRSQIGSVCSFIPGGKRTSFFLKSYSTLEHQTSWLRELLERNGIYLFQKGPPNVVFCKGLYLVGHGLPHAAIFELIHPQERRLEGNLVILSWRGITGYNCFS